MAQIKISVKGKLEMTLTRNYNSLSLFTANKDDVGFNETGNDFYNYSITSPCGSWVGDKIKILSLPNKGRLYYNSTPLSTPTYANVTVGQEIMVRDLIDYKVLRFSAEGSADGQFTESYLTNFTFERYCVSTAQNITVKVNLNMIDDKKPSFSVTETSRNENTDTCSDSFVEFNVTGEVTDEPLKLRYDGSPSGATVEITKIGTGLGIIKDASTGTEFYSDVQPADGQFNLFSEVDLLLTNTGTTKFRFRISSSINYRNPTTENMVLLSCTTLNISTT